MTIPDRRPVALIVSHTHWDREWYKTSEAFRVHLVPLVDEVLDQPDDAPFLLDGQAIVLEDYLAWRPERRADVSRALAHGVLEAGPWYVLGDNLIPGGEALVRNLLAGRSVLRFLRAESPGVLYCPDSFGHPAAGPLLAAGFGLTMVIVWRGYGGRLWPAGDTARWSHEGGAEVLLHHLPPSGYEFGSSLPHVEEQARQRWRELHDVLGPRSRTGVLLVLNGADHHARQRDLAAARASLRAAAAPTSVVGASLRTFARAVRERVASTDLPVISGELRASPDYTWSLQGTFGVRAAQKRDNARLEQRLTRVVEPLAALLTWQGGASQSFATRALWRLVLASHAHDTLCGCSIDDVAWAMNDRLLRAERGADELERHLVAELAAAGDGDRRFLVAVNPAARMRGGVVEADVDVRLATVPVGPGSGGAPPVAGGSTEVSIGARAFPSQIIGQRKLYSRSESPHRYPRNALVERQCTLLWMPELPANGVDVVTITEGKPGRPSVPRRVRAEGRRLTSDRLSVWVDPEHRLCVEADGRVMHDVLDFESEGERGDLYTHSTVPETHRKARLVRSRLTMRGPLRGELLLTWKVPVAPRAVRSATGEEVRHGDQEITLLTTVQLDAGRPWIRVIVQGQNDASDLRLRALLRTGIASDTHIADVAFGRVRRSSLAVEAEPADVESIPRTAPLHRYVTVSDGASAQGATVISAGLAEYEATPDGVVAATLLRSVGDLSRNDLPERPGHAGWPAATPDAQCHGPFTAELALMPHGPLTEDAVIAIEHAVEDFLTPPIAWTLPGNAVPDHPVQGPQLEGRGLRYEACKESEDGAALVLRCTNVLDRPVDGLWSLPGMTRASLSRLDETALGALAVVDSAVAFQVPAFGVSTIRVERDLDRVIG